MRPYITLVSLALLAAPGHLPSQENKDPKFDIRAHYTKYEYRIPMRDGKRLFTAAYVPKDSSKSYPILMSRTPYSVAPYGVDQYPEQLSPGEEFARDGFIFVYQDVRGRYMSEGTWFEMTPQRDKHESSSDIDESTDTYDTIDWLIHNVPGNNGKVGLVGISYPGFYTSAGMINAHPALIAASPQAPVSDLYMGDDAFHNGAFFLAANFGFYTGFSPQANPQKPSKEPRFDFGTPDGYRFYLDLGSIANADEKYFKYKNHYWTDMIAHPNYDSFWKSRNILPHLKNIRPAVLVVGGWYDAEDLSGTVKTFRAVEEGGTSSVSIVMGPWPHGGWSRSDGQKLGDIDFGSKTSKYFREEIELPFFRHYLKGTADGLPPRAWIFETGRNQWMRYDQWPPRDAAPQRFYLHEHGHLSTEKPTGNEGFDEYVSDPLKPVPYFDKVVQGMTRPYMLGDQRFAERRPDVLTYASEPLETDLILAGPVEAVLRISSTGTDSDFIVKVIDVYPDDLPDGSPEVKLGGYEQLVRGEPFRAKFRNSFEKPEPLVPNRTDTIRFSMPDIDHCFRRGHRVMVQVQSSWFPLVDRNPQIFTNIPTAARGDYKKATERVYHSSSDPSFIEVRVVGPVPVVH